MSLYDGYLYIEDETPDFDQAYEENNPADFYDDCDEDFYDEVGEGFYETDEIDFYVEPYDSDLWNEY